MAVVKAILWTLALLIAAVALAIAIVPHFLDRIYYEGPKTDHFDGERFFNPDGDQDALRLPTGGSRAGFFWRYFTGRDGRPPWPQNVEVAQAKPPARVEGDRMLVTWIGHASVLVQTQGLNILTDPVWSDRAGPFGFGPSRVTAPGVAFDDLPPIDIVLVSHNHYDHMDLATLERLWKRNHPIIVTSLGNDAIMRSAGIESRAFDWGGRLAIRPGIDVIVARNHHWGSRWFKDRNRALWSGFVVTLPAGGNLFFAGDTGVGDGRWIDQAASYGPIRLALLPIGAFRFTPGQMGIGSHMGPPDAVEVFRRLGASRAIPIHWGTFRLSYEAYDTPPRLLAAAMACGRQTGFAPVPIGEPTEVPAYRRPTPSPPIDRAELLRCLDTPAVRALR